MNPVRTLTAAALSVILSAIVAQAQREGPTGTDIVERFQQAFYYAGTDIKARVVMDLVSESGKKRTRGLTMLRKNDPKSKSQKYFMYFHEPGDVRRTALLVWKYDERDDDRWMFIPAINAVRRIAANDSRSSFVGSDFSYEDVSGRDVSADTHTLLREDRVGDADCYVVQSVPKTPIDYTKKLSWIDKKSFLPRKEEYYDAQNQLARLFTADRIQVFTSGVGDRKKEYPTVVQRTMANVKSGHRTEVTFGSIEYDVGLEDGIFTERSLETPPQKWIQ